MGNIECFQIGTRYEYRIAITQLDYDTIILTNISRTESVCNGVITHQSVIVNRSEMTSDLVARADFWTKCGILGAREDNVRLVPRICAILGCPNPGVYVGR